MLRDCLVAENHRNKLSQDLFQRLLELTFKPEMVVIGHHLSFVKDGNEEEIPSADTFLFDHEIMQIIFGVDYIRVIQQLAMVPTQERDQLLREICMAHGLI